jgi:hypothetical protein
MDASWDYMSVPIDYVESISQIVTLLHSTFGSMVWPDSPERSPIAKLTDREHLQDPESLAQGWRLRGERDLMRGRLPEPRTLP